MLVRPAIRLRRWLAAIGVAILLVAALAVAVLRIRFEGPDLAHTLTGMMNKSMRGRISADSVEWPTSGLAAVIRGGWVPLDVKNVKVWDDEGQLVLNTPRLTAEIDIHALMFGRHDFVLRKIKVHGGRVLLREVAEPYALHAYDKKVFSLLAAFYGRRKAGYYVGISASRKPVFDLRDFTIENVELEIWSGLKSKSKYGFRAIVQDVNAQGFLYMDASDPLVPKFYFSLEPSGGPGEIDIVWQRGDDGEWRGGYRFDVKRLAINALKQIPTTWPVSPVANTLRFDLDIDLAHSKDAELTTAKIKGAMVDYWDTPYGGSWQIVANLSNAGQVLKESVLVDLGGDDVNVRADITGSIVFYPRIDVAISGLTYDLKDFVPVDPVTGLRESVLLQLDDLHAGYDLAVNAGNVDAFRARGLGGELQASASFAGDGTNDAPFVVDATVDITTPLELGRWMAPCQRAILGSTLSGHVHARRFKGDTEIIATVEDIDLQAGGVHATGGRIVSDKSFGIVTVEDLRVRFRRTALTLGLTLDPRNLEMPPFTMRDISGVLGDALLLQRAADCAKPRPGKAAGRATGTRAPRRAPQRRANPGPHPVRPRPRPRLAAAPQPSYHHAQRSPIDRWTVGGRDIHTEGNAIVGSDLAVGGVPLVDKVTIGRFRYTEPVVEVGNVRMPKLGGAIRADGTLRLGPMTWIERLQIKASNVDLTRLLLARKSLAGRVSADVVLRGPVDPLRITAEGTVCSNKITALGDVYADVGVWLGRSPTAMKACPSVMPPVVDAAITSCLDVHKRGGRCAIAHLRRERGGELIARVSADKQQRLGGAIDVRALPLSAFAAMAGADWPAGAELEARGLRLGGTLDAPTLDGVIEVTRAWAKGSFLGDGRIAIASDGVGAVRLDGSFLDGRLALRGRVATTAPYRLDVTLEASRMPLDTAIDLAKLLGLPAAQVTASFRIRVRTSLGDPAAPLDIAFDLSELTATLAVPGLGDAPLPVDATLTAPVAATYDGHDLRLTQPATFATPLGTIAVLGTVGATQVDLSARGTLDVARALPFGGDYLDDATGRVDLTVRITGLSAAPRIKATLALADVGLRPTRQEAWLRIPEGKIEIDDATGANAGPGRRTISLTGLALEVDDGYSTDPASLSVSGGVNIRGGTPDEWNLIVSGSLGGEMLALAAPGDVASASGAADVTLTLSGQGRLPRVDGALTFDEARPLTVFSRRARREVALSEGTISVINDDKDRARVTIDIDEVGGTLDGEGRLRRIRGGIDLVGTELVGADVAGALEAFPYRVPRTLDLIINAELRGVIDGAELDLSGQVGLVSGQYVRDINFIGAVFRPSTSGPAPPPFWENSPLIANARLDLAVDVRGFAVANNIAKIDLDGGLRLTGTPRDPRLDGEVLVQRGTLKFPGLRPRFTRTSGSAQFEALLPLGQTPKLDIATEADYRDPSGQEHIITARLSGSFADPQLDLSTASGLNMAQTLTLIVSGRTPDEFRRNLGQGVIGSDPLRINPSTDDSAGYSDEVFRQLTGDLLGSNVADTLRDISGLEVARIEFNLGSFGFHGERTVAGVRFSGDLERTTRGSTASAHGELRMSTQFSLEGSALRKNYDDPAEPDITDVELKTVWRTSWR